MTRMSWGRAALGLLLLVIAGCVAPSATPAPTPQLATKLTVYSWSEYLPQAVLDQFTDEYGVAIDYVTYDSQEEAAATIQAGSVPFDVAVVAYDVVPALAQDDLLADIHRENTPNFRYINATFRNLIFDPDNDFATPYLWGTTGLLVRRDLAGGPVTQWADLWDERFAGKVLARPIAGELFGAALKAQGHSLNSEEPAQLDAALQQLEVLRPSIQFVEVDTDAALEPLLAGDAVVMLGWNGDALVAQEQNPNIEYVLPEEGAFAWVDNFVVSAKSPNVYTAETFINFMLRPEISAEVVEAYYYPSPNDAARQFVDADLRNNALIFPSAEDIANAEFFLPHSPAGEALYEEHWQQLMGTAQ